MPLAFQSCDKKLDLMSIDHALPVNKPEATQAISRWHNILKPQHPDLTLDMSQLYLSFSSSISLCARRASPCDYHRNIPRSVPNTSCGTYRNSVFNMMDLAVEKCSTTWTSRTILPSTTGTRPSVRVCARSSKRVFARIMRPCRLLKDLLRRSDGAIRLK